ncbi:MAG: transposase [Firmicutes bacterium]|nr:transposase [Bacillota bacterium]
MELDNIRGERSIKPFAIGRKNWLFANTPRGGPLQRHHLQRGGNRQGERAGSLPLLDVPVRTAAQHRHCEPGDAGRPSALVRLRARHLTGACSIQLLIEFTCIGAQLHQASTRMGGAGLFHAYFAAAYVAAAAGAPPVGTLEGVPQLRSKDWIVMASEEEHCAKWPSPFAPRECVRHAWFTRACNASTSC